MWVACRRPLARTGKVEQPASQVVHSATGLCGYHRRWPIERELAVQRLAHLEQLLLWLHRVHLVQDERCLGSSRPGRRVVWTLGRLHTHSA